MHWLSVSSCCGFEGFVVRGTCYCASLLSVLCHMQYHYRPGTFTGWLAQVLDDYSQRRKSALVGHNRIAWGNWGAGSMMMLSRHVSSIMCVK